MNMLDFQSIGNNVGGDSVLGQGDTNLDRQ